MISPDHTPRDDFFFWGFVKRLVYVPPIPRDMDKLKARIIEAVATIDNAMLGCVWQELDYGLDVCHVTNSAHNKHIQTFHVKIEITNFLNLPNAFLYP